MLKQWVAAIGVPQLIVMGVLIVMWGAEQWLAYTKRVKANSTMQAFFNALYAWARLRYPLIARLGNIADQLPPATAPSEPQAPPMPPISMLLPLLLIPTLLLTGCPATISGQPTTAQKFQDALAKAEPILKDIGAGVRDLGPCALPVVATVAQAIAGSPGWAATLVDDYECIAQGVAKLRADIAANKAAPPSPEHLQAVQAVVAVASALKASPPPVVVAPDPMAAPAP